MGGLGSGRSGGKPTIEDGLTLNLAKLLRDGFFRPGQSWGGSLTWTNTSTGERVASVGYEAHLDDEHGRVRLHYTTTRWGGEKHASDYWVTLETTPQPFGSRRWWFVCPRTGRRVTKLHLPNGALTFASRQAYRLGYRSQRETPRDRALGRAFKLRHQLGSREGIGDYIVKPKGMRWATFEREMAKVEAAEAIVDGHTQLLLKSLNRGLKR
ncbi:hypothetical protein OPKNFCMD_6825 [Methylobacterium crusticola]|uniref:Uncharacterized protein n=1 Tax=Methylobacterium crusticola TaxID=1697972 RepID=A0ABQ4R8I1_9HYPH|nr:hypothetical protein [Methylobacterium crusticola]GJD54045.1 hypothetical protein OPKNFCMD_6825 [Methylobacterium crusticola]